MLKKYAFYTSDAINFLKKAYDLTKEESNNLLERMKENQWIESISIEEKKKKEKSAYKLVKKKIIKKKKNRKNFFFTFFPLNH